MARIKFKVYIGYVLVIYSLTLYVASFLSGYSRLARHESHAIDTLKVIYRILMPFGRSDS